MTNKFSEEIIKQIVSESEIILKEGIAKIPEEQFNELFKQFCRLHGYTLPKSPIDSMIDKATGIEEERTLEFGKFLMEYVFMPLINKQIETDSN